MNHIYWVGIKESEIQTCKHLFKGSITFIGSGENGNISFSSSNGYIINYNEDSLELDDFIRKALHKVIEKDEYASFFCYTASYIYSLNDEEINKRIICANNRDTLQLLRNKMNCRLWLKRYVPVLPTIILTGSECIYEKLCSFFPNEIAFTIQGCTGAGGVDTYIMSIDNHKDIKDRLIKNHIYIISPYKIKSYSTNVHILFRKNNYSIAPGSIQIVEHHNGRMIYRGSDFIEYQNIPHQIIEKLQNYTKIIAEKIQLLSYKGILGIDYLIVGSEVYFLEINPRFQSSTRILNLSLYEYGFPSIQEQIVSIFYSEDTSNINALEHINIKHSNYIIDYENDHYDYENYFEVVNNSDEIEEVVLDGYCNGIRCQEGASIFSVTFKKNIISLNPNGIFNIYDNIKPHLLKNINLHSESDCKWLKFAIMNQGIHFSDTAKERITSFQKGVYSSIDIYITDTFIVNAPTEIPFHSISPFKISYDNDELSLYYGQTFVSNISIHEKKEYCNQYTKNGINFQHISFIATDRLRIHHASNCLFQSQKNGCKFCDVSGDSIIFNESDIKEVIDWHLDYSNFRHILIGGASGNYPQEYVRILEIIKYIKTKSNKPIYLMTLPPEDIFVLNQYYDLGVDAVAFNIEIYDRDIAKHVMPGKGQISLSTYKDALLHSVKLWGNTGKVRSLLVYGLESDETFINGIEWLASNGIQPIISPFRALGETVYANTVPPTTRDLMCIYNKATAICQKHNLTLGPDCIFCQNNTLSFDSSVVARFDS